MPEWPFPADDEADDSDECVDFVDPAAVRADDALLDALAAGDLRGAIDQADSDDPVVALLAAWAADIQRDAPLPPALRARVTCSGEPGRDRPVGRIGRKRSRWVRPTAAAAGAAAVLAVGLLGVEVAEAQPDDPLWSLSAVINPERARSVAAAAEVASGLERARVALREGRTVDAARELELLRSQLTVVRDTEGRGQLDREHDLLVAALTRSSTSRSPGLDSAESTAPATSGTRGPAPTPPSPRGGSILAAPPPAGPPPPTASPQPAPAPAAAETREEATDPTLEPAPAEPPPAPEPTPPSEAPPASESPSSSDAAPAPEPTPLQSTPAPEPTQPPEPGPTPTSSPSPDTAAPTSGPSSTGSVEEPIGQPSAGDGQPEQSREEATTSPATPTGDDDRAPASAAATPPSGTENRQTADASRTPPTAGDEKRSRGAPHPWLGSDATRRLTPGGVTGPRRSTPAPTTSPVTPRTSPPLGRVDDHSSPRARAPRSSTSERSGDHGTSSTEPDDQDGEANDTRSDHPVSTVVRGLVGLTGLSGCPLLEP